MVLALLTGSVIGNLLLVGGLSFFVGGLKFQRQLFNVFDARHNSGLLMFAVIVAFVYSRNFYKRYESIKNTWFKCWILVIMIVLVFSCFILQLVTHRGVYQSKETEEHIEEEVPEWSKGKAVIT